MTETISLEGLLHNNAGKLKAVKLLKGCLAAVKEINPKETEGHSDPKLVKACGFD